jgi:hypothetical protein
METVVTPNLGITVMEVVDVSSLIPTISPAIFLTACLTDGQDQGYTGQQRDCTPFFSFFLHMNLIHFLTNPAGGGGLISKAKDILHDMKDGGSGKRGGDGYSQPGNEGQY